MVKGGTGWYRLIRADRVLYGLLVGGCTGRYVEVLGGSGTW